MTDHWFKPKTHGYGASAANWKGWAATFVFLLLELVLAFVFLIRPMTAGGAFSTRLFVIWLVLTIVATVAFVWVAKAKTDGEWKWRWGEEDVGK